MDGCWSPLTTGGCSPRCRRCSRLAGFWPGAACGLSRGSERPRAPDAGRETALKEQLQGQLAEERVARRDDERALRAQLREAEERLASERGDLAVAKAQLVERARHLDELQHAFERRQAEFRNEFKVLSKEILDKSQQDLSERNREGVSSLLSPLSVQLDAFRKRTDELHDAQTKERGAMREQLAQLGLQHDGLRQDAEALAQALRQDKKTLGNWGEMQVERLLEMSGAEEGPGIPARTDLPGRRGSPETPGFRDHAAGGQALGHRQQGVAE